jgi:branched-chain amino acid transport system ATP-binding protein
VSEALTILDVRDICAGYGRSQVLFEVTLCARRSGGVAILGRNGAGKSTLLKTLIGEIRPMSGTIWFDGTDSTSEGPEQRVRRGMSYVPQEHAVFGKLSVHENLALGALAQKDKSGIDMVLEFFPKLGQRLSQQAGTLSGGERKMLAIGRALLSRPRLLLLDEPTEGVWVGVIEEIAERLAQLTREMSVVRVEQHVELPCVSPTMSMSWIAATSPWRVRPRRSKTIRSSCAIWRPDVMRGHRHVRREASSWPFSLRLRPRLRTSRRRSIDRFVRPQRVQPAPEQTDAFALYRTV